MPQKRVLKNVQIAENWLDLLRFKFPTLLEHGNAWAIESLIADKVGLPRPLTPQQARQRGAEARGKQLAGKPALNPKGRKRKSRRDTA